MPPDSRAIVGVVLAGGLSRRMGGGDKCLRPLAGKPILAHIIERARPQVTTLILNANGDGTRFVSFGLPVVPDVVEGFAGPLAGILTGLEWARRHVPQGRWVASFASDAPFLPRDLVARMLNAVADQGADLACAASGGQAHPVFGLWRVDLADDLRRALTIEGIHKVDQWTARYKLAEVEFATAPFDPFFNANRPEDLDAAEQIHAAAELRAAPPR
jgi:molybdopterin-guanine dinucleotide biosynthesis protein A